MGQSWMMLHSARYACTALALGVVCACAARAAVAPDALLELFPRAGLRHGSGTTAFSRRFEPAGSRWAPGLDERQVFHALLDHEDPSGPSWQLRIGKGGQIYSLIGPFGESVPPQCHPGAPWIDEVWQLVSVSGERSNPDRFPGRGAPAAYFIHGAGIYQRDAQRKAPFYSPLLASRYDAARRAAAVANWGQHAHVPSIHRSGVLYYIQYRDAGGGVLETTYLVHNFGADTLDYFNTPWGGVRRSSLPTHVLSRPDGGYEALGGRFGGARGPSTTRDVVATGGWAAFAQGDASPDAWALAVVFGTDRHLAEQRALSEAGKPAWQRHTTRWRWGIGADRGRLKGRDYVVAVVNPRCVVRPGETFFYRLFFVVGRLGEAAKRAVTLVRHVDYGILTFDPETTPLAPVYAAADPRTGQSIVAAQAPPGTKPLFLTWAWPVPGSVPLFLLRDTARDRLLITHDPYQLASTAPYENPYPPGHAKHARYARRRVLKPYDGATDYLGLLGYALVAGRARGVEASHRRLADVVTDRTLFPTPTPMHGKLLVRPGR